MKRGGKRNYGAIFSLSMCRILDGGKAGSKPCMQKRRNANVGRTERKINFLPLFLLNRDRKSFRMLTLEVAYCRKGILQSCVLSIFSRKSRNLFSPLFNFFFCLGKTESLLQTGLQLTRKKVDTLGGPFPRGGHVLQEKKVFPAFFCFWETAISYISRMFALPFISG